MHRLLRYFATLLLFTLATYATVNCQQTQNVQSFVQRFYVTILEREPDVAGLDDWTNKLIAHERTGATLAEGFIFSDEYTSKAVSDESYVSTLYKAFFNREAELRGLAYWLTQLEKKHMGKEEVLYGFTHSVEFANLSNQYGIEAYAGHGIGANLAGLDAFVTGFYETLLGRTPASAEVAYWTQKLSSGNATGTDIAKGFVFSAEYDERSKEDNTFLTDLYKTFFHRSPDKGGMAFWKKALTEGMSREVVLTKFLHSKEFETLAKSYGIKAYEGATLPTVAHTQNTDSNTPPQANAGADQSIEQGTEVTLDGSLSQDSDGTIACYWWREGANILSTHAQYTLETNTLALGRHTLLLSVADDRGVVATDAVRVEVKDANGNSNGAGANAGNSTNTTGSNVGGSASTGGTNTDDTDSGTQSEDVTPPIITLNGESNITLEQNAVYTELGARAVDAVDGNLTVSISGVVDTSTVGNYTLTYTATDSSDNEANITRSVEVANVIENMGYLVESNETEASTKSSIIQLSVNLIYDKNLTFDLKELQVCNDKRCWGVIESVNNVNLETQNKKSTLIANKLKVVDLGLFDMFDMNILDNLCDEKCDTNETCKNKINNFYSESAIDRIKYIFNGKKGEAKLPRKMLFTWFGNSLYIKLDKSITVPFNDRCFPQGNYKLYVPDYAYNYKFDSGVILNIPKGALNQMAFFRVIGQEGWEKEKEYFDFYRYGISFCDERADMTYDEVLGALEKGYALSTVPKYFSKEIGVYLPLRKSSIGKEELLREFKFFKGDNQGYTEDFEIVTIEDKKYLYFETNLTTFSPSFSDARGWK